MATGPPAGELCFVHAADLHLDTPFVGVRAESPYVADALADASLRAFDAVVELALRRHAAFVVLAGDIYDGPERGLRAQLRFRRGLEMLSEAGIASFVVHGNHDPIETGWSAIRSWPARVTVFPADEVVTRQVVLDGTPVASVQGVSYPQRAVTENLSLRFRRPPDELLAVGVLHCNVGGVRGHSDYSPCSLGDLRRAGFDYWALGHVHTRALLAGGDGGPFVVYPGNTQGRSVAESELGAKGAMVATFSGGAVDRVEFVACDAVRFERVNVDISIAGDVSRACELLLQAGAEALARADGRPIVVAATISGRGLVHADLARTGSADGLLRELRSCSEGSDPFLWWDSLRDRTRPELRREDLRRRSDFLADLVAMSDGLAGDRGALRILVARATSEQMPAALREVVARIGSDEEDLRDLLGEATDLALDLVAADWLGGTRG